MTRLHGGPADGVTLMLQRAPIYLRAVCIPGGDWDALNQLDDAPKASEQIIVYQRDGDGGWVHLRTNRGCRWYTSAEYRVLDLQPDDAAVRETAAWRAWCSVLAGEEA